jgi:carbamoyl-phosphate synthase large subunit
VSPLTALAKTVFEPRVVDASVEALRALDPTISGAFDVDLKDDADGAARVTEINAGRFLSGTTLFDLTGKHNMAAAFVRLALDEPVDIGDAYDVSEDHYMVRDLDTLPMVVHADQLYDGIGDARR